MHACLCICVNHQSCESSSFDCQMYTYLECCNMQMAVFKYLELIYQEVGPGETRT